MTTPVNQIACIPRREAARAIGIPIPTLDKMVMRGEIEATQNETGRWLFKPADVQRAQQRSGAKRRNNPKE